MKIDKNCGSKLNKDYGFLATPSFNNFKDEVSEETLKKRRKYYLTHGITTSGLLESSSLDITTPYMLRNDGELLKCGDIHPYIKSYRKESLEETLKYLDLHKSFLDWFYNNSLNKETKDLIENFDRTEETVERLWYLTNQEFCRVRTSNYRYKTGGDNGEIYFRISSENFNWFDLIWNVCVKYANSIDYITIMKDPQTFGKQFDYIKIGGEEMNKYPLKDFIELEGEPLVESLLLEDLPKEIKRDIYGKDYINVAYFVSGHLPEKTSIYDVLRDRAHIDVYRSSFRKVEKEDFLQLETGGNIPAGSIVCGDYRGISVVYISDGDRWYNLISIDSSKIKRWNRPSIEDYFASYNITKQGLKKDLDDNGWSDIIQNKLDNVEIFVCDSSLYGRNFKPKVTDKTDSLQKEFNKILSDNDIDLDQIDSSIKRIFSIRYLSLVAYEYVPSHLRNRYETWKNNLLGGIYSFDLDDLNELRGLRKKLTDAKKKFKLDPSIKNKRKLLDLKKEVKTANDKYLSSTINEENFDFMGCYFILKAFIEKIKELNSAIGTTWEKSNKDNDAIRDLSDYIGILDDFQKYQLRNDDFRSLSSTRGWVDINKKVKDTLSEALKKAQELLDKIRNENVTDTEYNILKLTSDLVNDLKYKLQTVLRLKQSMKEDLNKDSNINEDIEKHDTLNPLLFDENDELKPEIKEAIEKIVNHFVEDLRTDGVKIDVKDVILVGSNVSYNYTKDSDLDVHVIVDKDTLDCDPELYTLLYGAYRSLFNKNYDITIKGIPVEIYVELY